MPENPPIIAGTRIGHVHLKVADLDRALGFYCGVLGFELTQRYGSRRPLSRPAAITITSASTPGRATAARRRRPAPPAFSTPPSSIRPRPALADALRRVMAAGIPLDGASDHGVSEALYLRDPDENGVELYWDRPERNGRASRTARSPCSRSGWIWRICCGSGKLKRYGKRRASRVSNHETRAGGHPSRQPDGRSSG